MNKILDVMEDIKQNITDNQYKIIMDSLMEINKIENNILHLQFFKYSNKSMYICVLSITLFSSSICLFA